MELNKVIHGDSLEILKTLIKILLNFLNNYGIYNGH